MPTKKLGIVIGTNVYSDSKIPNLRFAEKDAKDVKNILLNPDICGFDNVVECINKSEKQTFYEICQLLKKAQYEDLLLIYFSGHGETDDQDDLCLLFNSTEKDNLIPTSLNYSMIKKCIKNSRCKTIIVILDCCYSGAAGIKGDNLEETLDKSSGSGTVVLSASSEIDTAKEDEKLENGVFTHYLIKGLKSGTVVGDNNGEISLFDLYGYAYKEVKERYSQIPYMKTDCEGKVIIGKNFSRAKEHEFNLKMTELVKLRKILPVDLYDFSMTILLNYRKDPSSLTSIETEIKNSLDQLFSGEIQIETYIHTAAYLKVENEKILGSNKKNLNLEPEEIKIVAPYSSSPDTMVLIEKDLEINDTLASPSTSYSMGMETKISDINTEKEESKKSENNISDFIIDLTNTKKSKSKIYNNISNMVNRGEGTYKNQSKTLTGPTNMEFVLIPAGEFMMGSTKFEDEKPTHKVTFNIPFYLGKYPVTQRQWKAVMNNNPSNFKGDDLPVEQVSWHDAQKFIKKLNEIVGTVKYRLPSEAEWEYACRTGETPDYCFGDNELNLRDYAWYNLNSNYKTCSVGQKNPNSWGLYDMHGNVWEWVQDKYHDNYVTAPSNKIAWEEGLNSHRVFRGGSWYDHPQSCRSSSRGRGISSSLRSNVGFRVLREV